MDGETNNILDMVIIDKRETQLKSTMMEPAGFKRVLESLIEKKLKIVEVVTDAHVSVTACMSKLYFAIILIEILLMFL